MEINQPVRRRSADMLKTTWSSLQSASQDSSVQNEQGLSTGNSKSVEVDFLGDQVDTTSQERQSELAFTIVGIEDEHKDGMLGYAGAPGVIPAGSGSLKRLMTGALPQGRRGRIKKAEQWAKEDDLLMDLLRIKEDFTMEGFALKGKPKLSLTDDDETAEKYQEFQEMLEELQGDMDAEKITSDLLRDWITTDNMILYWRVDESVTTDGMVSDSATPDESEGGPYGIPGVLEISVLNPGSVDWLNSLGQDILMIDIQPSLRIQIEEALRGKNSTSERNESIQSLIDQGIGLKWIQAVLKGDEQVELRKEDGDYWIIRTKERKNHGLASPSMYSIFYSLEIRRLFIEGDFSAAYLMKHFIQIIKQGESITSGPLAGNTRNWLSNDDAKKLLKIFSVVSKAIRMAVNHTTSIEFVFPPKEMFDPGKFETCESRIYNWSGVTVTLLTGKEGDYSGGHISIKKLISAIKRYRKELKLVIQRFFKHPSIKSRVSIPDGWSVTPIFDQSVVTEQRQILEEIKFLVEQNFMDPRSAVEELGRDADAIKASKIKSMEENEKTGVWGPVNKPELMLADPNNPGGEPPNPTKKEPGRPPNDETVVGEQTREQHPTPPK